MSDSFKELVKQKKLEKQRAQEAEQQRIQDEVSKRRLLKEVAKRQEARSREGEFPPWRLEDVCFDKQLEFIRSEERRKTAVCSRRAGKTWSCAADLINDAVTKSGIDVAYITLSRRSAKRIIWRQLLFFNKKFNLGGVVDKVELSISFPNDSTIWVSGAKDEAEVEKFRGMGLYKVYIDECQSFRPYLKTLIEDVLEPQLIDYNGYLILIGTPGPLCAGVFYEACHDPKAWAHFKWTMLDNPHLELKSGVEVKELMRRQRERRGLTESSPTYQREFLGKWVYDEEALVYKYNDNFNHYEELPKEYKWKHIIGIDIGHDDADAIAVLAYSEHSPEVYLVDEFVRSKQDITSLVEQIKYMRKKYSPTKMVMDSGGLGKKIQEEIRVRHHLPVIAAEKTRKYEFIELLNDDFRSGRMKIKNDTQAAEEYKLIQWDKKIPERWKISNSFHSDIADAILYGWRECKHYAYTKVQNKPKRGSDEYMDKLEEEEAEKMDRNKNKSLALGEFDLDDCLYDPEEPLLGEY